MSLTKKKDGQVYCAFSEFCKGKCYDCWAPRARLNRLAEYEDTGMEPGEIMALQERVKRTDEVDAIMKQKPAQVIFEYVGEEDKWIIVLPKSATVDSVINEPYCDGVMVNICISYYVAPPTKEGK